MSKLSNVSCYVTEKISVDSIDISEYITTDNLLQNKKGRVIAEKLPTQKVTRFKKNDILIANIRPYLKKIWQADIDGGASSDVLVVRPNDVIDNNFLYYALTQDSFFEYVMKGSKGTKMPRGDKSQIMDFVIPDLEIDEQIKIGKLLKSIDQKIQINNQINQELEAMAKTLYDYWFVQFDFPDQNGEPYKSSEGKMVYNPELKREIPEGWGVAKLNEVVDLISGYPFSSNDYVISGKYKLYTIKNVQDGYTVDKVDNYLDFLPSNMSHECQLRRGDLIMSLTGNVGRVGMVYEDDVLLNQRVLKLNPINKTHKSFIYSFFRSDVTKAHLENMSTGTSQKNLSPIDIGNMMIPFPSESLLSKFVNNLNMLENNLVENQQLTQLRDWLLPMLMNGQVKVE